MPDRRALHQVHPICLRIGYSLQHKEWNQKALSRGEDIPHSADAINGRDEFWMMKSLKMNMASDNIMFQILRSTLFPFSPPSTTYPRKTPWNRQHHISQRRPSYYAEGSISPLSARIRRQDPSFFTPPVSADLSVM